MNASFEIYFLIDHQNFLISSQKEKFIDVPAWF